MGTCTSRVVYGVCGIGNGHTLRAAPIIEALLDRDCMVAILAYKASYAYFSRVYASQSLVKVIPVAIPFFVGNSAGLDFAASLDVLTSSDGIGSTLANMYALAELQRWLGKPDLVLTDYEPLSAQYAYAYNAPLVTIDQQSKFLLNCFDTQLAGTSAVDEAARLRMFFPKADKRLVCSFYRCQDVADNELERMSMRWCPPPISRQVRDLVRTTGDKTSQKRILGYISAQAGKEFSQELFVQHCGKLPQVEWDLFFPEVSKLKVQAANVRCHAHGSDVFLATLAQCDGIVANAGHSLLAEAMYLGIPVLALPLKLYEQQLNALMVASHSFGMLVDQFDWEKAHEFVARLEYFAGEIASDTSVLIRGDGVSTVLEELDCYLA